MKHLIAALLITISTLASAGSWKTEKSTSFKGESEVYQVMKGQSGEIVIDEQQKHVALIVKSGVLSHIKGVKLDGVFFEAHGRAGHYDHWTSIVFSSEYSNPELYNALRNAKTIELNVYWHGDRNQVMKF